MYNKLIQLIYIPERDRLNILKRVNIHLSDRQVEQLKKLSRKLGISFAEIIRRLIDEFLEKQKQQGA